MLFIHCVLTARTALLVAICSAAMMLLSIAAQPAAAAAPVAPRPNIVLCMADDQGWGDVGYYDKTALQTPVLDEMSRSGLRFDRFYAAAPVCSPTRGSVLTGRHPNRFGCFSWGYTLRPQEVTLAEALKTAGYATGHFGKWHLGPVWASSPVCPGNSGFDEWFSSPNFYENNPLMSRRGTIVQTEGEGSQVTVEAALEFIRAAAARKQPFLAVIWFGSPHVPHQALPEDLARYKDLPPAVQNYMGEVTAMDRAVGNLRRELRTLGIADNTLLWYTSDNGAAAPGSTGGLSGKKGNLLEGGIRVPAIIEWPARIIAPRTTDLPCSTVDIYPTVLDLVGVSVPNQPQPLDGVSLVPLLDSKMTERPKPLGFWVYPAPGSGVPAAKILAAVRKAQQAGDKDATGDQRDFKPEQLAEKYSADKLPGHAAWIDGRYKLHRMADKQGNARYALYDLVADPKEKNDLAKAQPERLAKMQAELAAWQESVIGSLNGEDYRQ